jgi:hypothetical protein
MRYLAPSVPRPDRAENRHDPDREWLALVSGLDSPPYPGVAVATRSDIGPSGPQRVRVRVWRGEAPEGLRLVHRTVLYGRHMEEVKDHLGHSSIRVTSDRYGHLFPKARQAVADSLDQTSRRAAAQSPATKMPPKGSVVQFPDASQGPEKGP